MALLLAALGATSVLARPAGDGSVARRVAEREERNKALRAEREAEHQIAREAREQRRRERQRLAGVHKARANATATITCTQVTIRYFGFPDLPGNTVTETVKIAGATVLRKTFAFDGPTATDAIPVAGPPGKYQIDAFAKWRTNGFEGHFDIPQKLRCSPAPGLAVEKLQQIAGVTGTWTPAPLNGEVGQTVDYAIVVHNTGNVPLTLSGFSDPRCDPGSIAGGPPLGVLAPGVTTTYTCWHVLTLADQGAGSVTNTATLLGTPPRGEGLPSEQTTNTVVVSVGEGGGGGTGGGPPPGPGPGSTPGSPGSGTSFTPGGAAASAGTSTGSLPRFGVLSFTQTTPPSLLGPQGCVRSSFRASLKAKGVATVTFYLDGHRIRKLTAKSARRGKLTITINASRLRVGPHRLLAKIVMARASSTAKAVQASRSLTFVRCASAAIAPKFTG